MLGRRTTVARQIEMRHPVMSVRCIRVNRNIEMLLSQSPLFHCCDVVMLVAMELILPFCFDQVLLRMNKQPFFLQERLTNNCSIGHRVSFPSGNTPTFFVVLSPVVILMPHKNLHLGNIYNFTFQFISKLNSSSNISSFVATNWRNCISTFIKKFLGQNSLII